MYTVEYYSAIKNNAICCNLDEPRNHVKSEKDKYTVSLMCGILINDRNECLSQIEVYSQT